MISNLQRFSIIVPAYNESTFIIELLGKVKAEIANRHDVEIIVVDDGSTDDTRNLLYKNSNLYNQLVLHDKNQGKGGAVITGINAASGEYIFIQDADLEYSPSDYQKFFKVAEDLNPGVIIGSRLSAPAVTRVHYFWHKLGNRFLTLIFNLAHNTSFTDIYCGYLMFRKSAISPTRLKFKSWGQQAEILSFMCRNEDSIYEVPVSYFGRTYSEGKKIRAKDTFLVCLAICVTRLRRSDSATYSSI
jgi:glycosyltransferase involved in cell wall biosynthesis